VLVVHTHVSSILIRKLNVGIQLVWECVSHHVILHAQLLALVDVLITLHRTQASLNRGLVEDAHQDVLPIVLVYVSEYVKALVFKLVSKLVKLLALIIVNGNVTPIADPVVLKDVQMDVLKGVRDLVLRLAQGQLINIIFVPEVVVALANMIAIRIVLVGVVGQYVVLKMQERVKLIVD
jgi:hypothetical protein